MRHRPNRALTHLQLAVPFYLSSLILFCRIDCSFISL